MNDKESAGMACAGFILSLNLMAEMMRKKIVTKQEAIQLIRQSRAMLKNSGAFPSDPAAVKCADAALQSGEDVLEAIAQTWQSQSN